MPTSYEILGVTPDATLDDVKAARRSLARKWHPDRFAGDGPAAVARAHARLAAINEAADAIEAALAGRPPRDFAQQNPPARGGRAATDAGPGRAGPARRPPPPKGTTLYVKADRHQAFEDLVLAVSAFADPSMIDAPRSVEAMLDAPVSGVARFEVSRAEGKTRIAVRMIDGAAQATGRAAVVRDHLIEQLNFLETGSFAPGSTPPPR